MCSGALFLRITSGRRPNPTPTLTVSLTPTPTQDPSSCSPHVLDEHEKISADHLKKITSNLFGAFSWYVLYAMNAAKSTGTPFQEICYLAC